MVLKSPTLLYEKAHYRGHSYRRTIDRVEVACDIKQPSCDANILSVVEQGGYGVVLVQPAGYNNLVENNTHTFGQQMNSLGGLLSSFQWLEGLSA